MKAGELTRMALLVALMAVCTWISIPAAVPFTLQTFAVFFAVGALGGKRGTLAILGYIALGALGIPVFSGFTGGLGALLGPTGGYIVGFLAASLVTWALSSILGGGLGRLLFAMLCGLAVLYAFGTAWFMLVYTRANGPVTLMAALSWCVFPFILPDAAKILLAATLSRRLRKMGA